jgi:hypothetical protein
MFALKHHQRAMVTAAAEALPEEKRRTFLYRVAARLEIRGYRFTDDDLDEAVRLALVGLVHPQGTAA